MKLALVKTSAPAELAFEIEDDLNTARCLVEAATRLVEALGKVPGVEPISAVLRAAAERLASVEAERDARAKSITLR